MPGNAGFDAVRERPPAACGSGGLLTAAAWGENLPRLGPFTAQGDPNDLNPQAGTP